MQRVPLADNLAKNTRVFDFIPGPSGVLVRGDVSNAVAAGLNAMHFNFGERCQCIRYVLELDPIELQILPRREVAKAFVVDPGNMRESSKLSG